MKQSVKKKERRNPKKIVIKGFISLVILLFVLIILFVGTVRLGMFGEFPPDKALKQIHHNTATNIYSVDNKLLGRYYLQNRTNELLDDIPESFLEALVATEDVRFYTHKGIDYRSMTRVFVKTILLADRGSGGGSTITQQLAKNLYPRQNFGFLTLPVAKVKEIFIARKLEEFYEKDEILELYLNTVSFGENTWGIETAALIFFNKEPSTLKIEESALLVGLLKANSNYNPRRNEKAALTRRNVVLSQMYKYGYLNKEECDSLKQLPIQLNYHRLTHDEGLAPYFREHVRQECLKILETKKKPDGTKYNLYTDGLKVYTTLNAQMQKFAEKAMKKHLEKLQQEFERDWQGRAPWEKNVLLAKLQIEQSEPYQLLKSKGLSDTEVLEAMKEERVTRIFTWDGEKDTLISPLDSVMHHFKMLQSGFLAMNGTNGDILAWVGGIDYRYFKYDHVKSKRQTGSIIKPVVYASALERGVEPCDFYKNDSVVYADYDNWTPGNSDGEYGGYYSVKGALANSVNTISVKLLLEAGIDSTIHLARQMGIQSSLPETPSLALGTGDASLLEMLQVYSVFINQGARVNPRVIRRIEDADGNLVYTDPVHEPGDSVLSKKTAQKMTQMMKGVVDRGTANGLRTIWKFESELAGKTGTTQMNTDAWFIGMNPKIIVGTWVGGDSPVVRFRNAVYGQGAYSALPVCAYFFQDIFNDPTYNYLKTLSFNLPDSLKSAFDCNDFEESVKIRFKDVLEKEDVSIGDFIKNLFKRDKKKTKEKDTI
ncbi:MAG TPA: transglycosylase domain-containing protein [Bacteroidales bacterium]|nr:transglycosylase domain-containing protein [Bacteroidales bacterium]